MHIDFSQTALVIMLHTYFGIFLRHVDAFNS